MYIYIYVVCSDAIEDATCPIRLADEKKILGDFLSTHWKQAASPHVV